MHSFFATEYTIHFDDTMAYGSHHFMTGFKFQCEARETFMFGEFMYDVPGVAEELDKVFLFTADAYSRNLKSKRLGERVVVLLSLEEWGLASARFCYRVIDDVGDPVCAGFQTLVCADAKTGNPMPLPPKVFEAMNQVREIEELQDKISFRERVLAGGSKLEPLFSDSIRSMAVDYLKNERYPAPRVISAGSEQATDSIRHGGSLETAKLDGEDSDASEVWVFAGQGAFDADLLVERVQAWSHSSTTAQADLQRCEAVIKEAIGGDASALFSDSATRCAKAIADMPELMQPAIHLQNVLGGRLRQLSGRESEILMGHSFGEIAAFELAGCFDLVTGIHIVCLRAEAIRNAAPAGGGLMVAAAPRARLQIEAELLGLKDIVVAGRNHESQTVLSGPKDQLSTMQDALAGMDIRSMAIPSPSSFHHPCLERAASRWLAGMRQLQISAPTTPVFTCIGRRLIDERENVAEILASQLLRPFDLQGAVADVVNIGPGRFIDCGSTGALKRLIENTNVDGIEVQQTIATAAKQSGFVNGPVSPVVAATPQAKQKEEVAIPSIAIVGSGCILPGGATSPEQLFEAIADRRMGIVDVRNLDPHWSQDFYSGTLTPDKSTSHLAGRVNNDDIRVPTGVDPTVFNRFTRLQKLLCISIAPLVATLGGAENVMCFVGATADGFEDQDEAQSLAFLGIDPANAEVDRRLGTAKSSGRMPHDAVQDVFDAIIRPGLNVTLVDAACASSLYSVALGMNALETGKTDAVIAGGAFCPGPGNSCLFSQFNGTTSTGCRPFDAGADGVVFSEAAAFVTLRRFDDAKRNGLPIQAAVRATGLSSDGRSPSANVPQTKGQILSLQRCYTNYSVDPKSIRAIEGHGTSTSVGDSTELETLRQYFADHVDASIPVHSLKGTLGHAGWAAGTASLIAACEYLRRGIFPAQACHSVPSEKLADCSGTLNVARSPVTFPGGPLRVAIDGFGFGGANAHVVLENEAAANTFGPTTRDKTEDEDLVYVACQQLEPTLQVAGGKRFDRNAVTLPEKCIVLPELVDDMDISQTLSVKLTDEIISNLPGFSDEMRTRTSFVLAFQGKTERGVEATARVMNSRFQRQLGDNASMVSVLAEGYRRARPSGSYTLQCMMPNVATGRAALLFNLNGPNFVVDAGADSISSAIESASLLLRSGHESGTKLVVVAAIDASSNSLPKAKSDAIQSDEFAMAIGITTRSTAAEQGWEILGQVDDSRMPATRDGNPKAAMLQHATQLVEKLTSSSGTIGNGESNNGLESADDNCPIHTPAWIEKDTGVSAVQNDSSLAVVTSANRRRIDDLLKTLPPFCDRSLIVVAGANAKHAVAEIGDSRLVAFDLDDDHSVQSALAKVSEFQADAIIAADTVDSWALSDSLEEVAVDNSVCEALFLIARDNRERLGKGLELWGMFPGGYNGSLHTRTGSVAGLIKSILREIPATKCGVVCTDDSDLKSTLHCLAHERSQKETEPEVSYQNGQRFVRRLRIATAGNNVTAQVMLGRESVVVATGGARGVTALMLESLAEQFGCRIIAFGRSPLERGPDHLSADDAESQFYARFVEEHPGKNASEMKRAFAKAQARWEADRTIRNLNTINGTVEYMQVDVTDKAQVNRAMAEIHSRFGRIDLLIHGAGVQASMLLQDRTLADFRRTYSVKVVGLNHVVKAAKNQTGSIPAVHVLTSAYSVFGNDGQHDYGAANETMDRACDMTTQDQITNWTSIAWLAWDGIGMTRGSEYKALAAQRNLSGVDAATGQRIFRDVLSGKTGAAINVPVSEAEHLQYKLETAPAINQKSTGPMIEVPIDLASIGCLPYHLVRDTPTLPGAWIVDCMVHAALKLSDPTEICEAVIDQPSFMRFVRDAKGSNPNLRVFAEPVGDAIRTWMVLDVVHSSGELLSKDVVCAEATISFRGQPNRLQPSIDTSRNNGSTRLVRDPYCASQGGDVDLSGPFDCLGQIEIGNHGRRASVNANAGRVWQTDTPALLLDAAWRVAAVKATEDDALFVPVQIQQLIVPVNSANATAPQEELNWEIRSAKPELDGSDVRWARTEVIDDRGNVRIVVDRGFAKRQG